MQETDSTYKRDEREPYEADVDAAGRQGRSFRQRFGWLLGGVLTLILIAVAVPFLNVNRFQRRIVTSLSESLGRPIHLDRISLTVFPLPGLTIENLVVAEDPAFGAEPFVRSSAVHATLRISSLWRRRIEFTRIRFTDPSINLVKTSEGRWNLASILLQAARIEAAPTAQAQASTAPRFPYIEATGARLNLKLDQEKMPFSLTEAELALWLDSPGEWRLRLDGRPVRTDTDVSGTGTVQLEGRLGRATALDRMPIDLKAEWRNAPLGEASRVLFGQDAGIRGFMTLSAAAQGTIGESAVRATLHLAEVRRADFVPLANLTLNLECQATETAAFHSITDIGCAWPPALTNGPKIFVVAGSIPNASTLAGASFDVGTPGIPAGSLLNWVHVASSRVSPDISATGSLAGNVFFHPASPPAAVWGGQLAIGEGTLTVPGISAAPLFSGAVSGRVVSLPGVQQQRPGLVVAPVSLTLGGRDFATLDGRFDQYGYTLHLTGTALTAKLLALGAALPPIGDGLAEVLPKNDPVTPLRFDLSSTRSWNGAQSWEGSRAPASTPRHFLHR